MFYVCQGCIYDNETVFITAGKNIANYAPNIKRQNNPSFGIKNTVTVLLLVKK